MSTSTTGPEWSGELLDSPEMVEAWTTQLRRVLSEHADYVARMRRDAEAKWQANPPEGYSSFEAWWRHRWVTSPFGEIQDHLEKAATLTFRLEARYRRGRHEIPAARQAARAQQPPAIPQAAGTPGGGGPPQARSAGRRTSAPPGGGSFLDVIRGERSA